MSEAPFGIESLNAGHDRLSFRSGSDPLDRYFREQATQDVKRRVAACFVAVDDSRAIAGYYTLASAGILLADLPHELGKRLPRYPTVPAVRMGRLAVSQNFKGMGLGGALLPMPDRSACPVPPMPWWLMPGREAGLLSPPRICRLPSTPLTFFHWQRPGIPEGGKAAQ